MQNRGTTTVVRVKKKNGSILHIVMSPNPAKQERSLMAAREYLAALQQRVVAVTRKVAAVTTECFKFIRSDEFALRGPVEVLAGFREGKLYVQLAAPMSRGRRGG